ncbi:hypothetical protein F5883DRAFT_654887 [Diaporthe sp. PMI_573]|nr:hypothetical protein F5883DRAFT_654887 [Diaporthaceae sp. PMI_573]
MPQPIPLTGPSAPARLSPREAKRLRLKSIKRRATLVRKLNELHEICGFKVYTIFRKDYRTFIYSSNDNASWPPPRAAVLPAADCIRPGEFPGFKKQEDTAKGHLKEGPEENAASGPTEVS